MPLEKGNPCTKDCPDRPNCKGCERGNRWRNRKIAEDKAREPDFRYRMFESDLYQSRKEKSYKNRVGRNYHSDKDG